MNLVIFLTVCIILIGLSIGIVLRVLLKRDNQQDDTLEQQREADNINYLKKQLSDLEAKLHSKAITQLEYDEYKLEAERRLLSSLQVSSVQTDKTPIAFVISICVGLPMLAALLYIGLGTPIALNKTALTSVNSQPEQAQTVESALAAIQERLRVNPDDVEAKFALGNIYYTSGKFIQARDVFKELFSQQADRPDITIAYAEAQARTQQNLFKGIPVELIQRTLQLDPNHKKANWLLGVAAFQEGNSQEAINIWKKQFAREDNSDRERMMLERMITQAGGSIAKGVKKNAEPPHLYITASISDDLKGKYGPDDTVFIYAKAASGPPMPLAIYRTTVDKLPLSLTLTDADAMTPAMKLSMFTKIIAIARISKSGNAITQSGDLQGQSDILDSSGSQKISIEINTIVP